MNDKPAIICADDDRIAWLRLRSVILPLANPAMRRCSPAGRSR